MNNIREIASDFYDRCIDCKLCVKRCGMLEDFSVNPKQIFKNVAEGKDIDIKIPFSCTFCESCKKVCPKDINYKEVFSLFREDITLNNKRELKKIGCTSVRVHQMNSFSRVFSGSTHKNQQCEIVFLPGCSLSAYSPELIDKTYEYLKGKYSEIGLLLKCCGKPTLDIGDREKFTKYHSVLQKDLKELKVKTVITACINCYNTIKENNPNIKVVSLWEILAENGVPNNVKGRYGSDCTIFTIHDPCTARYNTSIQEAVRNILEQIGINIEESEKSRGNTDCCGYGGMVGALNGELTNRLSLKRANDLCRDYVISYCETCAEAMNSAGKSSVHILDLIFNERMINEKIFTQKVNGSIQKWGNRYKTKKLVVNK